METKDKYITPETKVLELHLEGIIAESKFDPSSGAGIDWLNALYSPNQKKKTILETVKIATEDGYLFKLLILRSFARYINYN